MRTNGNAKSNPLSLEPTTQRFIDSLAGPAVRAAVAQAISALRGALYDSEASLDEELRRESLEDDSLGGDTAMDRNLSGASTWVTVPANE